jgi:RNA polymerase sigma factor (sigma-70 family)
MKLMDKKLIKLKNETKEMSLDEVYIQFKNFLYKSCSTWLGLYEREDLFQVAYIGLHKAYKSYDISKDILFLTYASRLVMNELLMFHRKNKKHLDVSSLNAPVNTNEEGNTLELEEVIPDTMDCEEDAIKNIQLLELKEVIETLDPKDKDILTSRAFKNESQLSIANRLHISQSYVSRLYLKILAKVKKNIEKRREVLYLNGKAKLSREQLLVEAKRLGTSKEACIIIGEKYGLKPATVKFDMSSMGIIKELKAQGTSENIQDTKESQCIEGCIGVYEIKSDVVVLKSINGGFSVNKDNLKNLILELQEIHQMII